LIGKRRNDETIRLFVFVVNDFDFDFLIPIHVAMQFILKKRKIDSSLKLHRRHARKENARVDAHASSTRDANSLDRSMK